MKTVSTTPFFIGIDKAMMGGDRSETVLVAKDEQHKKQLEKSYPGVKVVIGQARYYSLPKDFELLRTES